MNRNPRHILLAEDDPRDAKLTLAALQADDLPHTVVVVNDGEAALNYLYCRGKFEARTGGNPIAVLLDLKMPKVDGMEVLKIIKSDRKLKTIPVVVLTSSREPQDLNECYQHGVNAYVVKPVDFAEFAKAIKRLDAFWAAVNEPPLDSGKEETELPKGYVHCLGTKEVKNEIPNIHPAR